MPSRMASEARRQASASARSMPPPPSPGGKRMGIVRDRNAHAPERPFGVSRERSFSSSSLVRIGVRQLDLVGGERRRLEQVLLGADRGVDRHHDLLADGVDRAGS